MAFAKEVILITGCSGRIGRRVAQKFADPRFLVFGLDTVRPDIATQNFTFISCDISKESEVRSSIARVQYPISSLIHLASYYSPSSGNWPLYERINVQGTEHILELAKSQSVEQVIFGSSILVYRPCEPGQKINEHWPVGPTWEYPRSLVLAEEYLRKNHGTIPLVLLRQGIGYDEYCHTFLLAREMQKIYEQKTSALFFPGNLAHGSSYVHFDDVADAIWLAVQRRKSLPSEMRVIVSEAETISYLELEKTIGHLCNGDEVTAWAIPKWLAKLAIRLKEKAPMLFETDLTDWIVDNIDANYSCDIGLAQEKLGWVPRHSFRQTLPKMIAHLKENPRTWYRENGLIFTEKTS